MSLSGVGIVVDVQHVYRTGLHARDRGTVYTVRGGKMYEADCARHYGDALIAFLRERGAMVWSNDPAGGKLVGPYERRQREATALGASIYLACHLNAGGGRYALAEYLDGAQGAGLGKCIVAELAALDEIESGHVASLQEGDRGAVCVRKFVAGPAVIVEPLFGDCPAHQPLMTAPGLALVGAAIGRGVETWWSAVGVA